MLPPLGVRVPDRVLAWVTAYRVIYGVAASYLTAYLAPYRPIAHAMVGGAFGFVGDPGGCNCDVECGASVWAALVSGCVDDFGAPAVVAGWVVAGAAGGVTLLPFIRRRNCEGIRRDASGPGEDGSWGEEWGEWGEWGDHQPL